MRHWITGIYLEDRRQGALHVLAKAQCRTRVVRRFSHDMSREE